MWRSWRLCIFTSDGNGWSMKVCGVGVYWSGVGRLPVMLGWGEWRGWRGWRGQLQPPAEIMTRQGGRNINCKGRVLIWWHCTGSIKCWKDSSQLQDECDISGVMCGAAGAAGRAPLLGAGVTWPGLGPSQCSGHQSPAHLSVSSILTHPTQWPHSQDGGEPGSGIHLWSQHCPAGPLLHHEHGRVFGLPSIQTWWEKKEYLLLC